MAQVSNQTQLLAALAAQDSTIQVTADFTISSQINILYPVTIESLTAAAPFTLSKDISYFTYLFRIQNGASLTLQNIILDGNKGNHPINNQNNRSLIYVTGGTLNLLEGSVIQNNNAYLEGGGIYLNRNESYPNTLTMNSNARITNCYSCTNGGGIMLAVGNTQDSFHISGASQINNNQAANGGGICFSGFRNGGNAASGTGGGIWIKNQSQDMGISAILTDITMKNNQASAHGGGMALYAGTGTFTFQMSGGTVSNNLASQEGGGFVISNEGAGTLTFNQSIFSQNTADGSGDGIYYANTGEGIASTLTMREVIISNNTAGRSGGGLNLVQQPLFFLKLLLLNLRNCYLFFPKIFFLLLTEKKNIIIIAICRYGSSVEC